MIRRMLGIIAVSTFLFGCPKKGDEPFEPRLVFKFKFNPNQERLGSLGQPVDVPAGNSAQSPTFNKMSAHYIELSPDANTPLGAGKVLYHAPERTMPNQDKAIDFDQSFRAGEGEIFFSIPVKDVVGKYEYLRVSLAYQNYDVQFRVNINGQDTDATGTIASFIGYRTYINSVQIKKQTLTVQDAKLQGFWAFENSLSSNISSGQSPQGATTVPNPLAATSPIPAGSCVVTGAFLDTNGATAPLNIIGNESQDVVIEVSLSTNKSFEWKDGNGNGKWEPLLNEQVVDMGIRGMKPYKR